MKTLSVLLQFLLAWLLISLIPTLLITVVWLCTFGAYNLVNVLHDEGTIAATAFLSIVGFVIAGFIIGEEN